MRTVIFICALIISDALNPEWYSKDEDFNIIVCTVIMIIAIIGDLFSFAIKINQLKPKK
jgi:hypothetical protein